MSLFKQMVIMFSLFLGIILVLVMVLNFKTANEFVQNQLYNDAKNTAHSLGLSLSKVADPNDISTMETMINAIYDSGYYEAIVLSDIDGKILYERKTEIVISDVPMWFTDIVSIKPASVNSDIMMGWSRFGTLKVSGHTGNAYRQLYGTLQQIVQTFLIVGVFVFVVLFFLLKLSLKSLVRIRDQAKAIIENQFIVETKVPFTTEFRSVTVAMNAMVGKVKDIFERENETLKRYQELLYKDGQTKLFNRRYAISKIPDYLQADSTLSTGSFGMFSFSEPEILKKICGYQAYNSLMALFSYEISKVFNSIEHCMIARMNEGDFLVLLPFVNQMDMEQKSTSLLISVKEKIQKIEGIDLEDIHLACGVSEYNARDTLKSLFSRVDNAIIQASARGSFALHGVANNDSSLTLGREEWKSELLLSIEESRFPLAFQSIVQIHDDIHSVLHEEIFLRLLDREGTIHSAGYFIPIATTLGLMDTLDRTMITNVLTYLEKEKLSTEMAINLSYDFIAKPANLVWLKATLESFSGRNGTKLWFEITNNTALNATDLVVQVASIVRNIGYKFGIDHFVLPEYGAGYLQIIRPDYIKANASYLSDMMLDKASGNVRESLNNLTKSLGISTIAMMIENKEQMDELQRLGIERFQGNFIAPVAMLK